MLKGERTVFKVLCKKFIGINPTKSETKTIDRCVNFLGNPVHVSVHVRADLSLFLGARALLFLLESSPTRSPQCDLQKQTARLYWL